MESLHEFLNRYQCTRFKTGENDCALFVAAWVRLLTGKDLAKRFQGHYCNDIGSHRLIRKLGFNDLEDMVHVLGDAVGVRRSTPLLAQRGDVAWLKGSHEHICGIVCANGVAVLGPEGLIIVPLSTIETAWQISCEVSDGC
ncbi:DUF6950 family protein [Vibrio nomapromontoriensis]|uniref:DUF6950 family protein n=1 Tax=Vibrio nomapromontoriensis TaxID=2910246 RepID=UPI003D0AA382